MKVQIVEPKVMQVRKELRNTFSDQLGDVGEMPRLQRSICIWLTS